MPYLLRKSGLSGRHITSSESHMTTNSLANARSMRSTPTATENILWQHLRATRLAACKFKRQQPIGNYIVDFVCLEARLIVEVDGGQHNESAHDVERDAWLRSQDFTVLRFWNNEVLQNLEEVLSVILEHLAPSLQPLPREGGEAISSKQRVPHNANALPALRVDSKQLASLPPGGGGTEGEGVGS